MAGGCVRTRAGSHPERLSSGLSPSPVFVAAISQPVWHRKGSTIDTLSLHPNSWPSRRPSSSGNVDHAYALVVVGGTDLAQIGLANSRNYDILIPCIGMNGGHIARDQPERAIHTFAIGARQLVVQDGKRQSQLIFICMKPHQRNPQLWLVGPTLFAPADDGRDCRVAKRLNIPARYQYWAPCGSSAGSRSWVIVILPLPASIQSSPKVIL